MKEIANMMLNKTENMLDLHQLALQKPLNDLGIILTTYCNLACKMCCCWKEREPGLSYERILSLLDEARALGATRFIPCGTEIFTREDTIDILSYAERIGYQEISVVSNGILLLDEQRLKQLEKLRTLLIIISLDGPREVHDELRGKGVFTKAVEALRELRQKGITCSISSVIMRQTLDRLKEIVDLAVGLGIPVISMQPYQRETAGLDNDHSIFEFSPEEEKNVSKKLKNLMRYARSKNIRVYTANMMDLVPPYLTRSIVPTPSNGCFVPSRLLLVDTSGESYPCFMMRRKKSMGNVHEKSLDNIWHNTIHRELNLLALNRKCPGCLAACSDVNSYDADIKRGGLIKMMRRLLNRG
jgi:MoaA/NifB/PqqE/SkfB family radical SAM enzyme